MKTPEQLKAAHAVYNKRWRDKHPDVVKARNKKLNADRSPEKHRANQRAYRARNPRLMKSIDLKKKYGITLDEYEGRLAAQQGCCAVCKSPPGKKALAVDHCHDTGIIRGILCHGCNTALGLLREDEKIVAALGRYLQQFNWLKA